jgi:outer membrane protein TolC
VAAAARARSPELRAARARAAQAAAGVSVARAAWIPEVAVFGQYLRQTVVAAAAPDLVTGGVRVSWTAVDFGRRGHEAEAAEARRRMAVEGAARAEEQLMVAVRRAWREAVRAERLLDAAGAAAGARASAARVVAQEAAAGRVVGAARLEAEALAATAAADHAAAAFGVRAAHAQLRRLAAGLP